MTKDIPPKIVKAELEAIKNSKSPPTVPKKDLFPTFKKGRQQVREGVQRAAQAVRNPRQTLRNAGAVDVAPFFSRMGTSIRNGAGNTRDALAITEHPTQEPTTKSLKPPTTKPLRTTTSTN